MLHGVSHHWTAPRGETGWNERNWGLGWRSGPWQAGVLRNSFNRQTIYAISDRMAGPVGVCVGVVSGYAQGLRPAACVVASYRVGDLALRVRWKPKVSPKSSWTSALELGWSY